MTVKTINKHEQRTKETRELLLQSAEKIFVRDGYEGAELGEIAALAGRTKGAIYAHFKSKEDIFLALVEQHRTRYRAEMEKMLAGSKSKEENIAAFRQFFFKLAEDHAFTLLLFEFKLFAIRHPESKERLQHFFAEGISDNQEKRLIRILGAAGEGKGSLSRSVATQTLLPLLSALALEAKFLPTLLTEQVLKKVAARIFDALMQA